jgi:hypothetical protein
MEHKFGSILRYYIQPRPGNFDSISCLQVDDLVFKTYFLTTAEAEAKEAVAEKALTFFKIVTQKQNMSPVPGFAKLKQNFLLGTPG